MLIYGSANSNAASPNYCQFMSDHRFNIRVYGILINSRNEVLLSTEKRKGMKFTKFPGGGLEWGEGLNDCIKREMKEELGLQVRISELFYLTEHFQESAFRSEDQLISVYYRLKADSLEDIQNGQLSLDPKEKHNYFHWRPLDEVDKGQLSFPIDKKVMEILKSDLD